MKASTRGIVIGLTLLAVLFAAAWVWQRNMFGTFHLERERRAGEADRVADPAAGHAPGWGEVLVGGAAGPSGAEPTPGPRPGPRPAMPASTAGESGTTPPPRPSPAAAPPPGAQDPETAERRVAVGPGESLWAIVRREYGRATPARVEALARYNELANPDLLAAGQSLRLPAPEVLAALAGE